MIEAADFVAGSPALDFLNTVGGVRSGAHDEKLETYSDLLQWAEMGGVLNKSDAAKLAAAAREHPDAASRVLKRARVFREALYGVIAALMRGRPAAKVELAVVNDEIGRALGHAVLRKGAHGYEWSWALPPDALDAPLWAVAKSAGELLTSHDHDRLRECASDTCGWIFLDLSKNHSRRWCDMKGCGNREKVRRYRVTSRA